MMGHAQQKLLTLHKIHFLLRLYFTKETYLHINKLKV